MGDKEEGLTPLPVPVRALKRSMKENEEKQEPIKYQKPGSANMELENRHTKSA